MRAVRWTPFKELGRGGRCAVCLLLLREAGATVLSRAVEYVTKAGKETVWAAMALPLPVSLLCAIYRAL